MATKLSDKFKRSKKVIYVGQNGARNLFNKIPIISLKLKKGIGSTLAGSVCVDFSFLPTLHPEPIIISFSAMVLSFSSFTIRCAAQLSQQSKLRITISIRFNFLSINSSSFIILIPITSLVWVIYRQFVQQFYLRKSVLLRP